MNGGSLMQVLKDEIRESIYIESVKEFKSNGFEKSSMRNIAKEAGIAVGNLYRYYKNKEDLFDAVVGPAFDKLVNFIVEHKGPETLNSDINNISFQMQFKGFANIYFQHKDEILIIIDGSKGTKYENAKDEIIKITENKIKDALKNCLQNNECIFDDVFIAHVISVSIVEGALVIIKEYKDDNKISDMLEKFIQFVLKDFLDRVRK